jgi:hypothetical protein
MTNSGVEREGHRRRSPAGVGVRQGARRTCPGCRDLPVGDRLGRLGDERGVLLISGSVEDVVCGRHRADDDRVPLVADAAQLRAPG